MTCCRPTSRAAFSGTLGGSSETMSAPRRTASSTRWPTGSSVKRRRCAGRSAGVEDVMTRPVLVLGLGAQGKAALHDLVSGDDTTSVVVADSDPRLEEYLQRYPRDCVS